MRSGSRHHARDEPPPAARENSPAFWWGFLRGFLIAPAAVLNASGLLFRLVFLVMAKNSGGYFSITNFFDGLARSARLSVLSACLSACRLPLSRRSCRFCGVLLRWAGVCLPALVSSLVGLFLAVLHGRAVALVVLRSLVARSFACCGSFACLVVYFPARVAFVRLRAFFGGASDCIKKTPHGGGVVVRCLFEIFINCAEKFRYNGEYYIYYHRRLALFQLLPAIIAGL